LQAKTGSTDSAGTGGHLVRGGLAALFAALAFAPAATGQHTGAVAQAGPRLLEVRLDPRFPRVGEEAVLTVVLRDPAAPISGLTIDFGEGGSSSAGRACQLGPSPTTGPFAPGARSTIRVRFTFRSSGRHEISGTAVSGGCDRERTVRVRYSVVVAPRSGPSPVPVPAGAATAARACPDANLVPTAANLRRVARATLCLINGERRSRGRKRLRASRKLARAAGAHTRDMVRRRYFAHKGPGGPTFRRRLRRARYRARPAGENIGSLSAGASPRTLVRAWMDSAPHRANILLRRYRAVGIGVLARRPSGGRSGGSTFTANFGRKRR
jgi:uncharacterized protein YkwD